MNDITPDAAPTPADNLHAELRSLIASSRQRLAGAVNAELTRLYWGVGERLHTEVLGDGRASYGTHLLDQLGQQLTQEFGRGFESRNLRRMVKCAESFPDAAIVSALSAQLSWSHMFAIVGLKTPQARQFYADQAATSTWSVRELAQQIDRKAFERTELASLQAPRPVQSPTVRAEPVEANTSVQSTSPAQVFKDPYFLDFLGLRQGHDEADLEAAILRQLEAFILELGRGFAFVERQKRMVIDGEDFYLDLLFYHRRLRRPARIFHRGSMRRALRRDGWLREATTRGRVPSGRSIVRPGARIRDAAHAEPFCRHPNIFGRSQLFLERKGTQNGGHGEICGLEAIELKLGRFKAAHKGQMELYLKWLDKHERQAGEEAPIGLILCAESSREQVELLQMHKDGITVAEYWTELPPKAELEQHLHQALIEARERLARRGVLLEGGEDE